MDTQSSSSSPYLPQKNKSCKCSVKCLQGLCSRRFHLHPLHRHSRSSECSSTRMTLSTPKEATANRSSNNNNYINSTQSYLCAECRRTLPTAHLLDLHIAEQHDFYFAASVERGDKPMFACYLEECGSKFHTPRQRKDHCITAHKFPVNYRFDQDHGNGHGKSKHKKSDESSMEVDELSAAGRKSVPYIKAFCFGHNTMRTFNTRKERQSGDTLEDVQDMKNALEDILD
ncbi:protein lethal(2)k10201 [Drosophila subobscura]|uniref:protein lethal(2)k10201 n=1 Tax=Drosophila subobscura TaxID=7241 RepID=UPI00155A6B84|nr:protein lethal(2)k10201 [Drosophila subobscura]